MSKPKIKIITVGHLPADINLQKIESWKSDIFEIQGHIDNYSLRADSDGPNWEYSDSTISSQLPASGDEDFLVVLAGVPLESNWYTRRVSKNKVVFTFHEISNYLRHKNIPLENVVFRLLYAYAIVYQRHNNSVPSVQETTNFTHDETRGCIFDMNGLKEDIVFSCDKPIICSECYERSVKDTISNTTLDKAKNELLEVKKLLFFRMSDWVKLHPIIAILLSSAWAVILGVIASSIVN